MFPKVSYSHPFLFLFILSNVSNLLYSLLMMPRWTASILTVLSAIHQHWSRPWWWLAEFQSWSQHFRSFCNHVAFSVLKTSFLYIPLKQHSFTPHLYFDSSDLYSVDSNSLLGWSITPSLCCFFFASQLVSRGKCKVSFSLCTRRFSPNFTVFRGTKLKCAPHMNTTIACDLWLRLRLFLYLT